MNKTDIAPISNIFENEISNHKNFYIKYLVKHKAKRLEILAELNKLIGKFQGYQGRSMLIGDTRYFSIIVDIENFLKKYWGMELLSHFNKEVAYKTSGKINPLKETGFWMTLLSSLAQVSEAQTEKTKAQINFQINFLAFLRDCLACEGLSKYIYQRDARIYKRFNLIVNFKENRKEYSITRVLLSQGELESEYLSPFYKSKPIFVHGKIIKSASISKLNITTTLLRYDDEIELFGYTKGFVWDKTKKDENSLAKYCLVETNTYLKNPNAETAKKPFKNNSLTYINQSRIDEISNIKSKWDLSRLVVLCNELNQNSTMGSVISVSALQRTIINYIPPLFGHESFGQVLAKGDFGKSVKKNLENLHNSMKNISDNQLHIKASKADSLPNITQVNFSNDLDVLLAEVCKVLK